MTIMTVCVLAIASVSYTNDIEEIVVEPIKKIIDIIQKLSEAPLRKPEEPVPDPNERRLQMKTKMLEQTIFKIGTLLQRGFGERGAQIVTRTLTNDQRF